MILSKAMMPSSFGRRGSGLRHFVAALAIVAFVSGNASAAVVYTFDDSNFLGDDANFGTVTVLDSSDGLAAGTVRFNLAINPLRPGDRFQSFGFNSNLAINGTNFGPGSAPATWLPPDFGGQQDGFGNFTATLGGNGNQERLTSVSITLTGLVATATAANFAFRSDGNGEGDVFFGAHLVPGTGSNTGYIGASNPGVTVSTPEASTVVMSGIIALAGLGYGWRRRKPAVA